MSTVSKGSNWRRRCVLFLETLGFHVVVRGIGFAGDDLRAVLGELDLSIEAKNHRRYDLAGWVTQAEENAEGAIPVVFAHRNGKAEAEQGYVIMTGAAFAQLVHKVSRDVKVLDNDITM